VLLEAGNRDGQPHAVHDTQEVIITALLASNHQCSYIIGISIHTKIYILGYLFIKMNFDSEGNPEALFLARSILHCRAFCRKFTAHQFGELPGKHRAQLQVLSPVRPLADSGDVITEEPLYLGPGIGIAAISEGELKHEAVSFRLPDTAAELYQSRLCAGNRVGHEVDDHLSQPVGITYDVFRHCLFYLRFNLDGDLRVPAPDHVDTVSHLITQPEGYLVKNHLSCFHL